MEQRTDWPLGPALKQHRIGQGLSVRGAAALTNKVVSETRWRQLESGFQSIPGGVAPINTTIRTVVAAAKAVQWNPREAAKLAGFDPNEAGPPHVAANFTATGTLSADVVNLEKVPNDVLLAEVGRRMKSGRPAAGQDGEDWPPGWGAGDQDPGVGGDEKGEHGDELGRG